MSGFKKARGCLTAFSALVSHFGGRPKPGLHQRAFKYLNCYYEYVRNMGNFKFSVSYKLCGAYNGGRGSRGCR